MTAEGKIDKNQHLRPPWRLPPGAKEEALPMRGAARVLCTAS